MNRSDVLIVGAGHAGAQTAIGLRNAKFAGSITLIGDEPELPYERPPLSKDYLAGVKPFERLLIRPPHFWQERGISIITGQRVTAVDPAAKRVLTADGTVFPGSGPTNTTLDFRQSASQRVTTPPCYAVIRRRAAFRWRISRAVE